MVRRERFRVLVVDEQREYYEQLREWAELCRYQYPVECEYLSSADEVDSKLHSSQPTVVLLDAHLSTANAFDVIERCHRGAVPVILASDFMSRELSERAKARGADGYVWKSQDPEDLEALLQHIVEMCPEVELTH